MRSKATEWVKTIGKGIFAGALAVQFVSAVLWAVGNFGVIQGFSEIPGYLERGKGFGNAALPGSFYSAFLRLFSGNAYVIAAVQLIFCSFLIYVALAAFLRTIQGENVPALPVFAGTVFIVSNPFCLTMIFSMLPYAPAAALALAALSYGFLYVFRAREKESLSYLIFAVLAVLFLYEFEIRIFASSVMVTEVFLLLGIIGIATDSTDGKKIKKLILPALFFLFLLAGMLLTFRKIPYLENNSKEGILLVKDIIKGWFAVLASPLLLLLRKYPFGDTLNPYLYSVLWQKMPSWTMFYFRSCAFGYALCVGISLVTGIAVRILSGREERTKGLKQKITFYALITLMSLFLFLSGRQEYDFRLCLVPVMLWGVIVLPAVTWLNREKIFLFKPAPAAPGGEMRPKNRNSQKELKEETE